MGLGCRSPKTAEEEEFPKHPLTESILVQPVRVLRESEHVGPSQPVANKPVIVKYSVKRCSSSFNKFVKH
jgi:hypothetical protein